ncbi:hypothetical protein HQ619_24820 [Burkholderia gladioli]|uniref:hypothetical protein n=1 Tax=Burkholderia gladioli TaxID=28095 RepID=UPI00155F9A73|nr:hypothetical protein [Burkholderia gladioli]NRF87169.1 hypothetical protein [Burkholderia gladioli]
MTDVRIEFPYSDVHAVTAAIPPDRDSIGAGFAPDATYVNGTQGVNPGNVTVSPHPESFGGYPNGSPGPMWMSADFFLARAVFSRAAAPPLSRLNSNLPM